MSKIQSRAQYYSLTISMQKSFNQSAQFIKSFVRYTWFKNPTIFKASPTFDNTHPIIIKVTFSFHKFVSAWKKSAQFINSFLRYSRFLESQDPKDYTFYHHDPKIIKVTFGFPEFLSTNQKPIYLFWDTANFSDLRPEWPHPFLTIPTPIFFNQLLFSDNLYQHATKSGFFIFLFWRHSQFKNPEIAETILAHISGTRFFPSIGLVQEYSK